MMSDYHLWFFFIILIMLVVSKAFMRSRRGTAASKGMGGLVWGGVREDGVVQSQTQMHSPCVVPNHQNDYHQRREQCK